MKYLSRSILLLIFFLGISIPAFACPVCPKLSFAEEVKKTDFIFVGKVVEIKEDKNYVPPKIEIESEVLQKLVDSRKRYFVKFKVIKKIKGIESDEIIFADYKAENIIGCSDYPLYEKGKTYLIYANERKNAEGKEEINGNGMCSRTRLLDKESKDYKESEKLSKNRDNNYK